MIVLRAIAKDVRHHFLLRAPEWWMSLAMIGVGAQLCRTGQALEVGRVYAVMRWMGDDAFWGFTALAFGLCRFVALAFNGTIKAFRRISPSIRSATALLSAGYWFCVGTSLGIMNNSSLLFPLVILMVVAELMLAAHIGTEVGRVEKRARNASARN